MAVWTFTAIIAVLAFGAAALPQTALRSGHLLLQLGAEKPGGGVTATPMMNVAIERPEPPALERSEPPAPKPTTPTGAVHSSDDGLEQPSRMKTMNYDDAVKRKPVPIIDNFLVFYWTIVIGVALTLAWFKHYVVMKRYVEEEGQEEEEVAEDLTMTPRKRERSVVEQMAHGLWRWGGDNATSHKPESGMEELEKNMWAMVLMAAIGQVHMAGRGGWSAKKVGPWAVAGVSIIMGSMQLTALFLIVHDIDPYAAPVTVHPSSPWGTSWTVNSMKWIMTIFMLVMMVSEAGQCVEVVQAALEVSDERLGGSSRWLPIMMEVFQYVIALCVVWAGVTVILSFQSVPNIIYCSMAVTFISNVDEMFFECVERVFHIEADFTIDHETSRGEKEIALPDTYRPQSQRGEKLFAHRGGAMGKSGSPLTSARLHRVQGAPAESAMESSAAMARTTTQGGLLKGDMREVPEWIHTVLRCVLVFPFFFGISLFFRACNTGILPSDRVHAIGHWFHGYY